MLVLLDRLVLRGHTAQIALPGDWLFLLLKALVASCCLLDVHEVDLVIVLTFFSGLGGWTCAAAVATNPLNTTHLARD